jgi:hypothetical protein
MKITKEDYLKLADDSISKREYDTIIGNIDNRFDEIMKFIAIGKIHWYDYSNGDSHAEIDGHFVPNNYGIRDYIGFEGDYTIPEPYADSGIPIRWLWEDFEVEFKHEVEKYKSQKIKDKETNKVKRETIKTKKANMKLIIRSKLTKEELKFIKFK